MREFAAEYFSFHYLNAKGKKSTRKEARFEQYSLLLDDDRIFFKDIYDTQHYDGKVVVTLFPFATISKEIMDQIIPGTFSIVLYAGEMAESVEYGIDTKISENQYENFLKNATKEERKNARKKNCPNCGSTINLTGIPDSANTYCEYCDNIFDRNQIIKFNSHQYQVCPSCEYYGRVGDYYEVLISLKGYKRKKHYCCDTCALRIIKKDIWWNIFPLLIGAFFSYLEYLKTTRGQNPYMIGLSKANQLAQDGKLDKADEIYTGILTKNFGHPGIHYNYGVATLRSGNLDRAAREFQISLQNCANYAPVIKMMEKHKDLTIADPSDTIVENWDMQVE